MQQSPKPKNWQWQPAKYYKTDQMKTFLIAEPDYNSDISREREEGWWSIADSALTNAGKPFFIPMGCGKVTVCPAYAVKINRLGKTIGEKFAIRYYDRIAPVITFRMEDRLMSLLEKKMPTDSAVSFDKAVFYGDFLTLEDFFNKEELIFLINNSVIHSLSIGNISKKINKLIAEISKTNTLKNGDLIIPFPDCHIPINIGDKIEISDKQNNVLLTVRIK